MNVETYADVFNYNGAPIMLQWSHVHVNVETPTNVSLRAWQSSLLQWSHVHVNVETATVYEVLKRFGASFNGATFM